MFFDLVSSSTHQHDHDTVQFVRLTGAFHGLDGPFQHQVLALAQLVDNAFQLLGVDSPVSHHLPDTLVLRRRIQVQGRTPSGGSPIVPTTETVHGVRGPCSPLDILFGDFIQALVSVDIVLALGEDGLPRTHVFLSLEQITRLRSPQGVPGLIVRLQCRCRVCGFF